MFTGLSPLAASKLVNSTPRQLVLSLTPIVRTAGRTHADAIDRFPIAETFFSIQLSFEIIVFLYCRHKQEYNCY